MIYMVYDERDLLQGVFNDRQQAELLEQELLLRGHTPKRETYALWQFYYT